MASQLGFDQWQSTAGVVRNTVVQTLQYHYPDRWTTSTADGTTWYNTPVIVSITPRFANSKIIGSLTGVFGTQYWELQGRIIRNDTTVVQQGGVEGSRPRAGFSCIQYMYGSTSDQESYNVSYNFLDTPNSTSAVTYRLQLNSYGGRSISINGPWYDGDSMDYMGCPTTQITIMEITQ